MKRWIRLDVGWHESDWLAELSTGARRAWVLLLGAVKRDGIGGQMKAPTTKWASRVWAIPEAEVGEMLAAATRHGAVGVEEGLWTVFGWEKYQKPDHTAPERMRRLRRNGTGDAVTPRNPSRDTDVDVDVDRKKTPRTRARAGTALPEGWTPNDVHREIAQAEGVALAREETAFRDHALATGRTLKDWDAGFRTWLRKAKAMAPRPAAARWDPKPDQGIVRPHAPLPPEEPAPPPEVHRAGFAGIREAMRPGHAA